MDTHLSAIKVVLAYLKSANHPGSVPQTPKDYGITHRPAGPDFGAPLYDLTLNDIYPDDVYGPNGFQYYQTHSEGDQEAYSIIKAVQGRPNKLVSIYRAVPHTLTNAERIEKYERHKAYILKYGRLPSDVYDDRSKHEYYDWISKEIERLKKTPEALPEEITSINPGDWVTISRRYAKEHGRSTLGGEYRILSAKARAGDLFTEGNSWLEYGYHPGKSVAGKKASYGFRVQTPPEIARLLPQLVKAAQETYDEWEQDEEGVDPMLGAGGLCQDVAEAMAGVLNTHGVDAGTVSSSVGDQHVWVVAKASDGVYTVDIEPSVYEIGSGYVWRKRQGVRFKPQNVDVTRIDPDPNTFEQYSEDY